jgi:hypothetical protein
MPNTQTIPPVSEDGHIPRGARCQEASILSRENYIPCGARAVAIVYHHRDLRGYYMCLPCADHNCRNRDGVLIASTNRELSKRYASPSAEDARLKPRLIKQRVSATDGTEEITFDCGHVTVQIIPLPADCDRMMCAQCIYDLVRDRRKASFDKWADEVNRRA